SRSRRPVAMDRGWTGLVQFLLVAALGGTVATGTAWAQSRQQSARGFARRGDVRFLPAPLVGRLTEIADRPHSQLPLIAFSEADEPSRLIQYYLLDTSGFQPNVFTSVVPGINDNGAIRTAANAANGGLPTIGAVPVVLEPKPGLPTAPNCVRPNPASYAAAARLTANTT